MKKSLILFGYIACLIVMVIALALAFSWYQQKRGAEKQLTHIQQELTRLETRFEDHQAFMETVDKRKDRCEKETRTTMTSYGSFQYCVSFLKWLDANPHYIDEVVVPK